jgi:hypothetical protein
MAAERELDGFGVFMEAVYGYIMGRSSLHLQHTLHSAVCLTNLVRRLEETIVLLRVTVRSGSQAGLDTKNTAAPAFKPLEPIETVTI